MSEQSPEKDCVEIDAAVARLGAWVALGWTPPKELASAIPPMLSDIPEPSGDHCPGCGWSSGGHDPRCVIPPDWCPHCGLYVGHAHPDCPGGMPPEDAE